jgi:uncharacterized protein YcgI (DUF1989 family)
MLVTIDRAFTSTTNMDTHGTVAAVCPACRPRITELLGGIS